jgi:hypothetical protein
MNDSSVPCTRDTVVPWMFVPLWTAEDVIFIPVSEMNVLRLQGLWHEIQQFLQPLLWKQAGCNWIMLQCIWNKFGNEYNKDSCLD